MKGKIKSCAWVIWHNPAGLYKVDFFASTRTCLSLISEKCDEETPDCSAFSFQVLKQVTNEMSRVSKVVSSSTYMYFQEDVVL